MCPGIAADESGPDTPVADGWSSRLSPGPTLAFTGSCVVISISFCHSVLQIKCKYIHTLKNVITESEKGLAPGS